jgi:hypothetical protein
VKALPAISLFVGFFASAACGSSSVTSAPSDAGTEPDAEVTVDGGEDASTGDFCALCGPVSSKGSVANPALNEASGLVASAVHDNRFYSHNDSGDTARFFAIDDSGKDFGVYSAPAVTAVDWEDIAVGPCPSGSCVYVADMGDNAEQRTSYAIYRAAEPSALTAGAHDITMEAFPFTYPDGSHNAETLLIHPDTGVITIVTKTATPPAGIYELPMPLTPGVSVKAIKRGTVTPIGKSPLITGGDLGPRGILLRTKTTVMFFPLGAEQAVSEALLAAPCSAPAPSEVQGEAIAWLRDGSGYATVSDMSGTSPRSPVSLVSCPK